LTKQTLDLAEGLPDLPVAFLAVKIDPHRNRRRHGLKVVGQFSKKEYASLHAISLLVLYLSGGSTHNAFQPSRSSSHGFWERFVGNKKKVSAKFLLQALLAQKNQRWEHRLASA
jgi:hypothetical protein